MKEIIYHGSEKIIKKPDIDLGKSNNDYGRGFYCTKSLELSKEWACKNATNGFSNIYELNLTDLKICNLNSNKYNILNWLAILTKYRGYWQRKSIAEEAKDYLQKHYYIDLSDYDIIIGYRADDSYFSFAQDFIMGSISLQKLQQAMKLGKLGEQIVLKSEKAFRQLNYIGNEPALADEFYSKKKQRDIVARKEYQTTKNSYSSDEIYILDILRGKINDSSLFI